VPVASGPGQANPILAGSAPACSPRFYRVAAGWQITGAKPAGGAQLFLLAVAAVAMGMQSAVVAVMGIAGVYRKVLPVPRTATVDDLSRRLDRDRVEPTRCG
jgi:hypothetical protein